MIFTEDKNSLSYKLRKNPFLLGLGIIVFAIVLIAMFTLISAVSQKTRELEALSESAAQTTQAPEPAETEPLTESTAVQKMPDLVLYDKNIASAVRDADGTHASITVNFKDKAALLDAHYAKNAGDVKIRPVFVFYLSDGTALDCPGQFKFLENNTGVTYYLNEIDDLKTAFAVSDSKTVDFENVFALDFNLYIEYKDADGVGKTLLGTASQDVKTLKASKNVASSLADGIKSVKLSSNGKIAWLDIYYDGAENYSKLNFAFKNSFIGFKYTYSGKEYDALFNISRYDSDCMIRCKFDTYSLEPLITETGDKSLTFESLFKSKLGIFVSDYDNTNDLFTLN